jgi:hypothetical protein
LRAHFRRFGCANAQSSALPSAALPYLATRELCSFSNEESALPVTVTVTLPGVRLTMPVAASLSKAAAGTLNASCSVCAKFHQNTVGTCPKLAKYLDNSPHIKYNCIDNN